jgi:hypothetical protein
MTLHLLQHIHHIDVDLDNIKLIGIYSSQEKAQGAVQRCSLMPGFKDTPEGFEIVEYELDEDRWDDGYVSL